MLTAQDIEKKLQELKPYLKDRFQVNEIGYFGSFAENKQTDESDIDILVNFSETPGWDFFTLEEFLESTFNRKIDLVTKTALRERLKGKILRQVKYVD